MRKRSLFIATLIMFFSIFFAMGLTACSNHNDSNSSNETEVYFTINCPAEMVVGNRIEIIITKSSESLELLHNDYEWKIVGENTVGGSFEFEDLDKNDNYTNKFFRATKPGIVQIQATNTTSGTLVSNIVKITVKGNYISTVEELKAIANTDNSYVLGATIDLSGESNWTPIEGFSGTLSGGGFSIINLTISAVNVENIGLFNILQGTVEDLKIENAKIAARGDAGFAGIVAGTNRGIITNVTVSGDVSPEYYNNVGGLVGWNDGGSIINCINQATITGSNNVGGIAGQSLINIDNAITGCVNEGIINGKDSVGGIAGYLTCVNQKKNSTYLISKNENKNTITGDNKVGGIFGEVYGMYCYVSNSSKYYGYFEMSVLTNTGEIKGSPTGSDTGGLIGNATRLKLMTTCENMGDVSGGNCVGGFVGYAPGTNIKATGAVNRNTIIGKGKVGGFAGHAGVIEDAINSGEIISTGVLVESGNSRAYVGGIAGYCEGAIGCENNVDIKIEKNGSYVGGIAGYINVSQNDKVNDNINYGSIIGKDSVGGIAGYLTCVNQQKNTTYLISKNENKNTITGDNKVGGIFGEVYGMYCYVSNSSKYYGYFEMSVLTNTGEIKGSPTGSDTGGLIGNATRLKLMTTCENMGDVSGGNCVGGFVGYAPGTNIKATGSSNNNIISGRYKVGGFAGHAGVIENAINSGEIVSIGISESGESFIGGIAGYCEGVIGCVNNIDIEIKNSGKYIGGIAGYINVSQNDKVNDNINYGSIIGKDNVGGIAGYLTCVNQQKNSTYLISKNENKNTITGDNKVGGIFGEVYGMYCYVSNSSKYYGYFEVINCVNESKITGTSYIGGIVGAYTRLKTDSNLMDTNTTLYGEKLGQQLD